MISFLKGTFYEKSGRCFVVVNNVGYKIKTVNEHVNGSEVELLVTCIHMSTGEAVLYGFLKEEEQLVFEELVKVQGVGGGVALNILKSLGVETLVKAVQLKDKTVFAKIRGAGPKVVDRILTSLNIPDAVTIGESNNLVKDALNALLALGFKPKEANDLLDSFNSDGLTTVAEYVSKALQNKGKGQ